MSILKETIQEYLSPKGILTTTMSILTLIIGTTTIPKLMNKSSELLNSIDNFVESTNNVVKTSVRNNFISIKISDFYKVTCERASFEDLITDSKAKDVDDARAKQLINITYKDKDKDNVSGTIDLNKLSKGKYISFHNKSDGMYYVYFRDDANFIQLVKQPEKESQWE